MRRKRKRRKKRNGLTGELEELVKTIALITVQAPRPWRGKDACEQPFSENFLLETEVKTSMR